MVEGRVTFFGKRLKQKIRHVFLDVFCALV